MGQTLRVSTDGGAGPYIMVPASQLDQVMALLKADKISFWVDEEVISLDGQPEIAVVNLGHGNDPVAIQRLLDSIP
jgi:hypothetical protein